MSLFSIPRFIISSDRSSSGKTTITMGLIKLLEENGFSVQPFKVALDYIDPEYHSEISSRKCRNLDGYLMDENIIKNIFINACNEIDSKNNVANIAIIEGVRGLYEGIDGILDIGSTAQISKILKCPIIFVINVKSITKSCSAIIKGFMEIDHDIDIKGIILNNVRSKDHSLKIIKSINYYLKIPVVGIIYRDNEIELDMKNFGLESIPKQLLNKEIFYSKINRLSNKLNQSINLKEVLNIANNNKPINIDENHRNIFSTKNNIKNSITIGIPYDEAFNNYYEDNINLFKINGAKLKKFSILHDEYPPEDIDAIYIGGGDIEPFLEDLENNSSMRKTIRKYSLDGMPIYGESLGMNYLTKKVILNNKEHSMVNALPGTSVILKDKRIVNYTKGIFIKNSIIGLNKDVFKAHEFHNTKIIDIKSNDNYAISIERGSGIQNKKDGLMNNNTIGTYSRFHGMAYNGWIKLIIENAIQYHKIKK